MLQIKTPEIYVNEPGAIKSLGSLVDTYGKRGLILLDEAYIDIVEGPYFNP